MSDSAAAGSVLVDAQHPWLGLLPFKEIHKDYFFGRDAEITEILERIQENTLTVLFGQSGLGKSSLLGAGVLPRLAGAGGAPVLLRLDFDPAAPSLIDQTRNSLRQALPAASWLGDSGAVPLWELLHRLPPAVTPSAPAPVLIFDQFEEIFTLGRQHPAREAEAEEWLEQIADLLQNRPPKALEERFAENRKLARDYDFGRSRLRVVFAMREDYLSHLEQWKSHLPLLTQNRMALQLLDGPQALEAVLGPASLAKHPLLTREVAAGIVRTVARVPADTPLNRIQAVPPLLSLLCEQLNAARLTCSAAEITADMVSGQSADILQRFYEESYVVFPAEQREIIREIVEDRMVTVGGHRHPVAREDGEAELLARGIPAPGYVFDSLIAHRLLTAEEHGGLQRLEVTHDVLIPLLVRSRKERRDRVAKEQAERKLAEEKLLTRKRRQLLAGAVILTLLAVAGAIFGLLSSREAKRQRDDAALQRDEARYNEGLGWLLRAQVAEERKNQYPDTLLYAAKAIGFEGLGRPDDAPDGLLRFIRRERNLETYQTARKWISGRPAYLPIWSSAPYPSPVTGLDVSSDGRFLALATANGAVRLWDLRNQTMREIQKPEAKAGNLAFDPFGKTLAAMAVNEVHLHDLAGGKVSGFLENTEVLAFSPGGEVMATAGDDGSIRMRRDGKVTSIDTGMKIAASGIVFSADNSRAAAVFSEGIRVFFPNYAALAYAWTAHQGKSSAVALSPDGLRLAAGTPEGEIVIYDASSAKVIDRCSGEQRHAGSIAALCFRQDGLQLASASADGTARLWDTSKDIPTVTATLRGHAGGVSGVTYFPGGDLLATAGADGGARIWNVSGKRMEALDLHHYLAAPWYSFDATTQEAAWAGGEGAVNVSLESLLGLHRAKAEVVPYLLAARAWTGLPEETTCPPALFAEAEAAAKAGHWLTVELRLGQMERLMTQAGEKLRQRQQALAAKGKPFENAEGIELLWCEPGTFLMGSPAKTKDHEGEEGRFDNETQHTVTLTQGYWLAKTELTQAQWTAVMGSNPSTYASSGLQAPVENLSWEEAMDYCHRLTDRERARGTIRPGWEYSLPTEAQWEYACRAGSSFAYSFGNDPAELYKHGNYNDKTGNFANADPEHDDGKAYTAPVGTFPLNQWGFHDMHGNVYEWCRDAMDPAKPDYGAADDRDPLMLGGAHRVNRGGGFNYPARLCRAAYRAAVPPSYRSSSLGFRPALVPP